MIGDRLQRIGHCLVRDETYSMIIAPAIADLQFEAPTGSYVRFRAYASIWRAILGGLIDEIGSDVADTFTRSRMSRAFSVVGATLTVIVAIHVAVLPWNWGFRAQDEGLLFPLLLPALLVSTWPTLMLPAAAAVVRRGDKGSVRTITLAACISALLMLACLDYGVTRTSQYFRQVAYERQGHVGVVQPGVRERPLSDLARREDRQSRTELHFRLALCASGIGWALIGLSLARLHPAALVVVGVVAYGIELVPIPLVTSGIRGLKVPVWSPWIAAMGLIALGIAAARTNQRTDEPAN